jgi:transposase
VATSHTSLGVESARSWAVWRCRLTAHVTREQRQLACRLHARGMSLREISRQAGCSHEVVRTGVRRASTRPGSQDWPPGPGG